MQDDASTRSSGTATTLTSEQSNEDSLAFHLEVYVLLGTTARQMIMSEAYDPAPPCLECLTVYSKASDMKCLGTDDYNAFVQQMGELQQALNIATTLKSFGKQKDSSDVAMLKNRLSVQRVSVETLFFHNKLHDDEEGEWSEKGMSKNPDHVLSEIKPYYVAWRDTKGAYGSEVIRAGITAVVNKAERIEGEAKKYGKPSHAVKATLYVAYTLWRWNRMATSVDEHDIDPQVNNTAQNSCFDDSCHIS